MKVSLKMGVGAVCLAWAMVAQAQERFQWARCCP